MPQQSVQVSGDVHGNITVAGGDVITYRSTTVFDAAFIQWMALGSARFLHWLRLFGAALLAGVLVAVLTHTILGSGSGSPQSLSVAIVHSAVGAALGGLIAWYQRRLAPALLRIAWVEGGLIAAEIVFANLFLPSESVPSFFGLPILHASLLVSLVAGPWLAILTFAIVKVFLSDGREQGAHSRWLKETITIVGSALVAGIVVHILGTAMRLNQRPAPVDPEVEPEVVTETQVIPGWTSGAIPPDCVKGDDGNYYCTQESYRYPHRDGFITLPGWLTLTQAVAILVTLAMIVPAAAALSLAARARLKLRQVEIGLAVGLATGALLGFALDLATSVGNASPPSLDSPLAWGLIGLVTGAAAVLLTLALRLNLHPEPETLTIPDESDQ